MKSDDVARYLQDHPEFFEQYADLLTLVTLPDPHSGRAISITEKQLVNLRDKVRALEAKLVELIRFGEENDAISGKVHGLAVALIAATDQAAVMRALYSHLGGAFAVPHVALRLWGIGAGDGHEFDSVADAVTALASGLQQPWCGAVTGQESLAWFGEAAAIALTDELLALGTDINPGDLSGIFLRVNRGIIHPHLILHGHGRSDLRIHGIPVI